MGELLLAGDIGATKSDLMVLATDSAPPRVIAQATLPSRRYRALPELVGAFLSGIEARPRRASFSVAGPVLDGRARLPNLGWSFDGEEVRQALDLGSVLLFNDLQATACAVPHLRNEQLLTLQAGEPVAGGAKGVIAPGTGLGEALLISRGAEYVPFPTEGGHTDFAPADEEQRELLQHLSRELEHVSWESVCSGKGIANIYRFLLASGQAEEPAESASVIATADDPTRAIVDAGMVPTHARAASARALVVFTTILAAEAANLALRGLTTGGLYIGGGLPPRLRDLLLRDDFLCAFRRKGLMAELVRRVPLHLILEPRTALWGAVHYGLSTVRPAGYTEPLADPELPPGWRGRDVGLFFPIA